MTLSLDVIGIGVPEVEAARSFYTAALSPVVAEDGDRVTFDIHGTGHVALQETAALAAEAGVEPATSGFRGVVVSFIINQPSEVEALQDAAVKSGAEVLKPAKKGFWGGFSSAYQAPDGTIVTLTSPSKKDTGPASSPPRPAETSALLGVASPKASKSFYAALGMAVDRDYGNKYVDFKPSGGSCRLGLMTRKDLAKDVRVSADGAGFAAAVFVCKAETRAEVDSMLATAASAGGRIVAAAVGAEDGSYAGHFADPDGFIWKVETAAS